MSISLPPLWSEQQLADYLQVSVSRLQYWRKHQGLPHLKVGKVIRYVPREVLAWLSQFRENTPQTELDQPLRYLT